MSTWTTKWTGSYPNLCSGEWELYKDGIQVQTDIPFQRKPALTGGVYPWWELNDDGSELWEDYEDGFTPDFWTEILYEEWLGTLAPKEEWLDIYNAFQRNDWRQGSCGGCL